MALIPVQCPYCRTTDVSKHGTTAQGKQRYRCQNANGTNHTFILDYTYSGRLPVIKQQIMDMALNGSGIRDIARVLKISPTTVISELKKRLHNFNMSITRSYRGSIPRTFSSSYVKSKRQKSMKCGALSATKPSNDGYGMPLIIEQG